ncbi:hypothetical protein CcaverHIS002_0411180 [Cutaneotrichosporon cavernicola]|nr:hypothetical protein CcaverHIS002_0411180 [Cutaneotrichosporon cavernicola]BEJ00060.1 hypothetical protein CcaverHIS631_0411020 [Cutaneotrichosporon cavernicola]
MPEEKDAIMCGETSPNLEPAIYPPTPATTVPSTISRPHPSAQASSEVYAKSPARLQRASERAWAALAAMQPRYEHQDPVAAATPAPPSPALGPVDAEVSDEGEQFADVEDDEEIYQFSDDGRFDIFDAALDPDVPQFDLSWGEVEADEEDIEMASGRTTPKRVRFAWDIGGVGESDPGFKVWRDGY